MACRRHRRRAVPNRAIVRDLKDVQTGLVWATKILTDPFHDIKLYHKAPLALLRGELIDPGIRAEWDEEEAEEAPHLT
ncbi:hypothetical protein SBBP2_3070002 [Burkholderiales bacterium]|nr:hypothetical protein SBBP2_3070002 [Burkholderiales bacterium]